MLSSIFVPLYGVILGRLSGAEQNLNISKNGIDWSAAGLWLLGIVCYHLLARWSVRQWGLALALACTGFALVLPMHSLEPFLLMLSSIFVPLYGVILGRLGGSSQSLAGSQKSMDWSAAGLWLAGIACYHLLAQLAPQWGAALPTLALTFLLARMSRSVRVSQLEAQT